MAGNWALVFVYIKKANDLKRPRNKIQESERENGLRAAFITQ